MIIENPDAFKSWLTSILEPLCDADPAALAKYVYALVKKDKPLDELRDGMLDQLDVFLQQETKPFVDMLFKALENNEYVQMMEKTHPSPQPEQEMEKEQPAEPENHVACTVSHCWAKPWRITSTCSVMHVQMMEKTQPSPQPEQVEKEQPAEPENHALENDEYVKMMEKTHPSPQPKQEMEKEQPAKPENHALENNEYVRTMEKKLVSPQPEQEMRKEQLAEQENHVGTGSGAGAGAGAAVGSGGGVPRARSPHAGAAPRHRVVVCRAHTAKVPPPPPPLPPQREHTLVKVLPLTELLEEPVDQPPRRRDRRENMREDRRRRRSRSWERRARARRHPPPHPHPRDLREPERDDRRRPPSRSPSPRGRFRNRSPPAVLDRPNTRSRSRSPVPVRERERELERDRLRPRELDRDRMSRDREHRDRASRSRDRERSRDRSRSRSHSVSPARAREPDHYKRRCRDFDEKGYCMRGDLCQWDHGADPVVLEDAALTSVLTMPPVVPEYNPLTPDIWCGAGPGAYPPYPPPSLPPRELIPIPRLHAAPPGPPPPGPMRPPAPNKKNFDYNRLGGRMPPRAQNSGANCSLEVKKVPRGLNDITHLNNHFGKFGKIVNIQVCFEGDPEGALITFSNHTEANVAYKSTEAVLNNRFIKVFWHNPENKQENPSPGGQQKPANKQQPTSHNKVLINKENMKATADNKQALAAAEKAKEAVAVANGAEKKKEAPKPIEKSKQVMEMHKRAQALLETQLQQQVLLIQRLEGGNVTGPQRAALMEAINSAQEGIEKLRKELVAYNRTLRQMQEETVARSLSRLQLAQANAKKPKTREEAQKEILDAELDMFTKQQEGQDVTDIQKKIAELRRQMALQFPAHPAMRRPHSRGGRFNSASRFTRAPPAFVNHNQSVDHRPRALLISGFESDDSEALIQHFAQFGEIVSKELNPTVPELVLVYAARAHAELAAQQGRHYNDRTLQITWVANPKTFAAAARAPEPAPRVDVQPETDNGHEQSVGATVDSLLRFDDDDEEDGDRSWRR
ncbi:zinc finger protein swm [Cydia splendana]|uniref:zinc finger protein swm n=1 Tax=Cydia splendana TaxID=1100963 RepID=UPI00300CBFFD